MINKLLIDPYMDREIRGVFNSLIGAMNALSPNSSPITVSGNTTLTDMQSMAGVLLLSGAPGAGFNLTLPTTTDITRRLSGFLPLDNTCHFFIDIVNETGQTATLVAGDASTTLVGTMTLATGKVGRYFVSLTSGIAITIKRVGLFDV